MSIDTILDRLQLCYEEITGIVRSDRLPPSKAIPITDLPCAYTIPRGMVQTAPRLSAGLYEVPRRFAARVLVAKTNIASFDTSEEGAVILARAVPFLDRFLNYFMAHPHLSTSTLPDLAGLARDVSVQDGGLEPGIPGPGGETFVALTVLIDIVERRQASRIS